MIACNVVEIETPKKVTLNGLWFGTQKPKDVIILVHGLSSSAFSRMSLVELLAKGDTAVLTFNNRGHDVITRVRKGTKSFRAGAAHEVFTEAVDDIDGAITFAREQGATRIFLAGHSTGCQKSVLWTAKRKGQGIAGVILLAPLSDYLCPTPVEKLYLARATKAAQKLVAEGKSHELLAPTLWPGSPVDAQRFLSLNTPDSIEQSIFTYFEPKRPARLYASITLPILVILAGADEHADRPAEDIATWFTAKQRSTQFQVIVIPEASHSFTGSEMVVADGIKRFVNKDR